MLFITQYPDWIDLFHPIMRYFIIYFSWFLCLLYSCWCGFRITHRIYASKAIRQTLCLHQANIFANKWPVTWNFAFDKNVLEKKFRPFCICAALIAPLSIAKAEDLYEKQFRISRAAATSNHYLDNRKIPSEQTKTTPQTIECHVQQDPDFRIRLMAKWCWNQRMALLLVRVPAALIFPVNERVCIMLSGTNTHTQ